MSKLKYEKELTELEYMLEKYERENISPILSKSYKTLVSNQQKEREKYFNSQSSAAGAFVPIHGQTLRNAKEMQKLEWNSKNVDWLTNNVGKEIQKNDKLAEDISFLIKNYQVVLYNEFGKDKYVKLSREVGTDYATFYVNKRLQDKMTDQLAKYKVPKSSMEYVTKKIMDDSIIGTIREWTFGESSANEKELDMKIEKIYSPSGLEKATAKIGASVVDITTTYLTPFPFKPSLTATVAWDAGITAATTVKDHYIKDSTSTEELSQYTFGSSGTINKLEANAKKISSGSSIYLKRINNLLNKPVKLSQGKYSPYQYKEADRLLLSIKDDSETFLQAIESAAKEEKVKIKKHNSLPPWMQKMSRSDLAKYSAHFTAIGMTMTNNNIKQMKVDGKVMTAEQVWQKGYNYAVALRQYDINQQKKSMEKTEDVYLQPQQEAQDTKTWKETSTTQENMKKKSDEYSGWEEMLEQALPNGAKDIISNLGYILSVLPDLLLGMLTGKGNALALKDNIFPLAAIIAGLFIKRNSFLKMLLLGFGGATLFYRASKDALDTKKIESDNTKPYRFYKTYADQPLNSRISNPNIKDGVLLMSIDGEPNMITLSDVALENYRQGKLPLNTLANKVLEVWDNQKLALNEELENERNINTRQKQSLTV